MQKGLQGRRCDAGKMWLSFQEGRGKRGKALKQQLAGRWGCCEKNYCSIKAAFFSNICMNLVNHILMKSHSGFMSQLCLIPVLLHEHHTGENVWDRMCWVWHCVAASSSSHNPNIQHGWLTHQKWGYLGICSSRHLYCQGMHHRPSRYS